MIASVGDRMSRGTALALAHGFVAVATGLTWVALLADAPVAVVVAASTTITTAVAVVRPIHYATIPQLAVSADELVSANAVSSGGEQFAFFAGPVVAGVIIELSGPPLLLMLALVASVLGTALCVRLRLGAPEAPEDGEPEGFRAAFEGFVALKGDWGSLSLLLLMTIPFVLGGALDVLGVAFSDEVLGQGEAGAGLVIGATGVGGLVGAAVATGFAGRRRLTPTITIVGVATGALFGAVATTSSLLPAMVIIAGVGLGEAVLMVCGRTLLQRSTDDRVLSRVFAVQESTSLLGLAVGAAVVPFLIDRFGAAGAFVPLGFLAAALVLVGAVSVRRLDARAVFRPRETGLLRRVPFFALLPAYEVERLAQKARWVEVAGGSDVVRQGEPGTEFFVVEHGSYAVTVDGVRRDHQLGSQDSFGEIALLHAVLRTATITALEPGRLLAVGAPDFLAAVTGSADGVALAREVASAHVARDAR
jgi:MFS family permease